MVVWNIFSPWKLEWWGHYFFVVYLAVPLCAAVITTFWFTIGGVIDMKRLLHDLRNRTVNPLDNGQVEGNVSLSDQAAFEKAEKSSEKNKAENL